MFNQSFNSILELLNTFDTEEKCIAYIEKMRRNGNVVSPFDASSKVYVCKGGKFKCKNSGKYFNCKTGTIFDNTKLPLQKRFLAIRLITSHKKGISSLQLHRDLAITQKSAWFMLSRIRKCFNLEIEKLDGEVEIDETYVGGKEKNKHAHKKTKNNQGRSTKTKTAVVGTVQRGGKILAKKVDDVQAETLTDFAIKHIKKQARVFTDEWVGYKNIAKTFKEHGVVHHGKGEYVSGDAHTNTLEGFRSLLKRGILGIYHSVSRKHLQKYIDEFVFRYNSRKMTECERMNFFFKVCDKRLTYKQLING